VTDYLNIQKIVPLPPLDPNVNVATQLNSNWDLLDTKLAPYQNGTTVTPTETGQEYINSSGRYAVWDGAAERVPDDIDSAWSAWTNLPLFSSRAIRTGFQPKWRNNSLLRMVQLTGGFQADSSASAFTPANIYFVTDDNAAGGIPQSMKPIGSKHICPCAVALTAGSVVVASGYMTIDAPGGAANCRLRVQYLGGPGGGNFVMLDQIWWWY
jgi:hypothetical protein